MPTNTFLISDSSGTAGIELTPAFGVHGPGELIVLVDGNVQGPEGSDQGIEYRNQDSEDENEQGDLCRSQWDKL